MLKSRTLIESIQRVMNKKIGIIGACFDKGQTRDGTQLGPDVFREAGIVSHLNELNYDVKDLGDVYTRGKIPLDTTANSFACKNVEIVAEASSQLKKKVIECLREERICLTIGGDHSLAIGSVSGHHKVNPRVAVLWIDAHCDLNTELTSPSGNMHGMPLSFMVRGIDPKYGNSSGLAKVFEDVKPFLDHNSLSYIGLRDIDPGEKLFMDTLGIKYFTMNDIDRIGIREATRQALDTINPNRDRPLHVSFDVDSLDPLYAPSTGTPVPGGLTLNEALSIGEMISATDLLRCLDIVEVNPKIGTASDVRKTINSSMSIIASFLGTLSRPYLIDSQERRLRHLYNADFDENAIEKAIVR